MIPGDRSAKRRRAASRWIAALCGAVAAVAAASGVNAAEPGPANIVQFQVIADGIPDAIGGAMGDAARGRALILAHESVNCLVCHGLPDPGVRFSGNLGPTLGGIARTLSVAQLRLRVVDNMRVHPATIMPSYYRVEGFDRVAGAYRGKPILDAKQVEDIVAYLATLK
jgi:L-cysteine S-thiosulfotransferase